ncbi:MAG: BsaA family SipW-dependent biofilm matrix protein [Oscillospiraceae bacterium]|nr:BsaA family SipW-dependent biofilm matrix protein [Oscillospiraceae bacterium]
MVKNRLIILFARQTFAWFTSQDEVTNRLTANADYGVSIVEDFTPPENMTPGQEVNKDVSVVNTGNIDALVRVQIENMLKIKTYGGQAITLGTATTTTQGTGSDAYDLTDFKVSYPTIPGTETAVELNAEEYTDSNGVKHANEVSLIQAGGALVVAAGIAVDVDAQNVKSGDVTNPDYSGNDQFKPTAEGLYIFRRTVYEGTGNATVKYSGYYYKDNKYYALVTDVVNGTNATVYLPDGAVEEGAAGTGSVVTALAADKIKIKTTKESDLAATKAMLSTAFGTLTSGTWADSASPAEATYIKLTYDPTDASDTTTGTADDVVFYIKLADGWASNWTYKNDATSISNGLPVGHFYLKNDLEAGETSPKLIDSVTMSDAVTQLAYVDLTYDINVVLDSVQVTLDQEGNELLPSAKPFGDTGASAAATMSGKEIDSITWT